MHWIATSGKNVATETSAKRLWTAADPLRAKVNDAMRDIEKHNPQLAGVLPKTYHLSSNTQLKKVSEIPATVDYDAFGRIDCSSLGEFARTEGQNGVAFDTPSCSARLLAEIIEPNHGHILDPAGGSGPADAGFVSSARLVAEHKRPQPVWENTSPSVP